MDEHTIRVLEFEKVLQLLAAEAAFSVGRELALAVRPSTEYAAAFDLQSETAEMRLLDQMGIDMPFAGARDIRPLIHSAAIGQVLEPGDLAEAAQTLKTARRARLVLEKVRDRVPRLAAIADAIGDFRRFSDEVDKAISTGGRWPTPPASNWPPRGASFGSPSSGWNSEPRRRSQTQSAAVSPRRGC